MQSLKRNATLQGGQYRIEKVLGQGGFGITYEGETITEVGGNLGQMKTSVKVAIKEFFMQDFCQRQEDGCTVNIVANEKRVLRYKKKFVEEANKLANINHPHIVKAIHVFEENNTVYYVMLFLNGGSLKSTVKRSVLGRLEAPVAVDFVKQVGAALDYLHNEKRMCHFDVKPENILVNNNGQAVLIDFGISKTFDDESGDSGATTSVNYSASYSPLELYKPMTTFSPQTDIYSLGATLYYLLTGKTPPDANEVYNNGLPPKSNYVPDFLWNAIEKAMQPKRSNRPDTVMEWLAMLDEDFIIDDGDDVGGETIIEDDSDTRTGGVTRDDTVGTSSTKAKKSFPLMTVLIVVLVAALAAVGGTLAYKYISEGPGPKTEVVEEQSISTYDAMRKLDKADITLKEVMAIKKTCKNDGTPEEQQKLKKRILALTCIYQQVLYKPEHKVKQLNNVYRSYEEAFSQEQIHAILTIFNKPESIQKKWETSGMTVTSLAEFQEKINELK